AATRHQHRFDQLHRLRVAKIQAVRALGDDDGVAAVGGEVQVVRILDLQRVDFVAGGGGDARDAVPEVVQHPQRLEIVRRRAVLRLSADLEVVHDLEGVRVDHIHGIPTAVRDVDALGKAAHHRAQIAGTSGGVYVVAVE